jgi:hypothetical protein
MPLQNSTWVDGNVPFGARKVVFYRQVTPGSGVWATKIGTYVLQNITPKRTSRTVKRYDEVGQPNGSFGVADFVEGSAVVQLATTVGDGTAGTTIPIRDGDGFATVLDPSNPVQLNTVTNAESFVVTSADAPEEQLGYKVQNVSIQKLYSSTVSAT